MTKLVFQPTHRVLIKATEEGYDYHTVLIDVNNGTFCKRDVDSNDTKIRVSKGVLAEKLGYNGKNDYNTALTEKEALRAVDDFNIKRAELGFEPVEFYRIERAYAESK